MVSELPDPHDVTRLIHTAREGDAAAKSDWALARAWLHRALGGREDA